MSRYFVIGKSVSYGTLHGMYSTAIVEADTLEELEEWGTSLSGDVLTDYGEMIFGGLYEDLEEQYGENWNEEDEAIKVIDEAYFSEIEYSIYKIKDSALSIEGLDKASAELGWETFVDGFCEEAWDYEKEILK